MTTEQNLQTRYAQLDALMQVQQLDALLITSRDGHLSEYTALENNPRYQLSEFDGSVGDAIFLSAAVADKLGISAETVKLHRKHAYAKLDISSQAELFYLFVDALASHTGDRGADPLTSYHHQSTRAG